MDIFSIKGPRNIMKSWNKVRICRSRGFVAAQDCWSPAAVQAQLPRLHFSQIFSTVPYFDHHFPSFINLIPVLLLPKLRLCCWTVAAANPGKLRPPQAWPAAAATVVEEEGENATINMDPDHKIKTRNFLVTVFRTFDVSNDGRLSRAEVDRVLAALGRRYE